MKFKIFLIILIVGFLFFTKTLQAESPTIELQEVTATQLVAFYFGDDSKVMLAIAECESNQSQFKSNGEVVKSPTKDYGFFQVNESAWNKVAKEKGLDYKNSLKDNIELAKHIKDKQGLKAWSTYNNGCYKKYL